MAQGNNLDQIITTPYAPPPIDVPNMGVGEALSSGFKSGLQNNTAPTVGRFLDQNFSSGQGVHGEPINDEEAWKSSPWYRPGLRYEPNLTWEWAQSMANAHDDAQETSLLQQRMGGGAKVADFMGNMGAGFLDPINWIALPSSFLRTAITETGSKVLGHAAYGALTNMAITGATAPFQASYANDMQQHYTFGDFAENEAIAGGLGALFGGLAGRFDRSHPVNNNEARPTSAINNLGIPENTDALAKPTDTGMFAPDAATTPSVPDAANVTPRSSVPGALTADELRNRLRRPSPVAPDAKVETAAEAFTKENLASVSAPDLMDSLKQKLDAATTPAERANALIEFAKTVPREAWDKIVGDQRTATDKGDVRSLSRELVAQAFNQVRGGRDQWGNLLSHDTKAGALWEVANDPTGVTALTKNETLFNLRDSGYSTIILDKGHAPDTLGEHNYVEYKPGMVTDDGKDHISGTALSLSRGQEGILSYAKKETSAKKYVLEIKDGENAGTHEFSGIAKLKQALENLRNETGWARADRVVDGERFTTNNVVPQVETAHFESLQKAWDNIKKQMGSVDEERLRAMADDMFERIRTPEDLNEMAKQLGERFPNSAEFKSTVENTVKRSEELAAQREALRSAALCILGLK